MNKNSGEAKNKLVIIAVVIILVVLVGIVGYFAYDNTQFQVVSNEVSKINAETEIDMNIKARGKYKNLEKGIKEYANEYYQSVKELKALYEKDDLKDCLGIENIKSDGPNFDNTKLKINSFREEEPKLKTKLQEMVSEEYLNKKVEELGLDEKMKQLYLSTLNLKSDVDSIISISDSYNACIDSIEKVLNFLNENQSNWSVKDEKIMFNKVDLLSEYNSLISTHRINQTKLSNKVK